MRHSVKIVLFLLFVFILLWNVGAGTPPEPFFQESETVTPESTQPGNGENQTPTGAIPDFTGTSDPFSASTNEPADAVDQPLPAMFAAGPFVQNELVVRFKATTSWTRIDECFLGLDVHIQSEIEELNSYVITDDSGEIASTYYRVLDCAGVLYVEPNFLLQATDTLPNDPNWGFQYGLINIRAPQGWDYTTGSAAVTIAIVDTGVDYGHPDLAGKLTAGYDFVNNDDNPQDDNGHGTHVAGIAAATSNNGVGVSGVSWGARIMPVKVLRADAGGTFADTAAGVVWAVDHGAQVINLSLGGTGASALLEDAINYAHARGAVVVAAAGNAGNNFVLYPARYPNAIAVARTNNANHWDGSNYGPEIDLSAPGTSIYSTVIGGYDYKSGSSMSTGFVSGQAAILIGLPGNSSPDAIKYQMESTALDIESPGWDEYTGAGLIQMDTAIRLALQPTNFPDDSTRQLGGAGSIPIQVPLTNTPVPTWTESPTLPSQTTTDTLTAAPSLATTTIETDTSTTTEPKREVEAQDTPGISNYILPCVGILLILLGILLVWIIRREQKRNPPRI